MAGREHGDADALALAAEAFMNLRQWDYYERATGELRAEAARAEQLIQATLALAPRHALAHHLHIHIAEGGHPGKGDACAGHASCCALSRLERPRSPQAAWLHGHARALATQCCGVQEMPSSGHWRPGPCVSAGVLPAGRWPGWGRCARSCQARP